LKLVDARKLAERGSKNWSHGAWFSSARSAICGTALSRASFLTPSNEILKAPCAPSRRWDANGWNSTLLILSGVKRKPSRGARAQATTMSRLGPVTCSRRRSRIPAWRTRTLVHDNADDGAEMALSSSAVSSLGW